MPSIEEARHRLIAEIGQARENGVAVLKIIHGYGSTGKGGTLRGALRTSLLHRKKEGLVTRIIFGEKWSVFEDNARYAIGLCPELCKGSRPQPQQSGHHLRPPGVNA